MKEEAISLVKMKGISTPGRFLKNWAYLFSSSVFCRMFGMIAMIRIARVLAPEGYGYYNIVQISAGIGLVIAGFGLRNVITRDCARNPENTKILYLTSLFIRGSFGILIGGGIFLYALASPSVLLPSLSGYAVMILFGQIIWDTTESISFGRERMDISARINAIGSVVWVLWIWCSPSSLLTVVVVSLSFAVLQLMKAGIFIWQVRTIIPSSFALDKKILKKAFRNLIVSGLPFYWLALLEMIQYQFPVLILAERSNPEQVGLFNVGFRLLQPLRLFFLTNASVLYPYLSKLKVQNEEKYKWAIEKALKTTVIIGSGCAFLVSLLRAEVVGILFGAEYAGSADAMAYQCWYTVLWAISLLLGTSLAASDKQRWLAVLTTIYTVVSFPIIWYGAAFGATMLAAAMTIGTIISLILYWYFFQKSLPDRFQTGFTIRVFAILFGAVLSSWLIPDDISIAIKILIACFILFLIAIVLLKEWKYIREQYRERQLKSVDYLKD